MKKQYKHCWKGGPGDYDVCHHGYDFCNCTCQQCQEALKEEDLDRCKAAVEDLYKTSPEVLQFILDNHEYISQRLKAINNDTHTDH